MVTCDLLFAAYVIMERERAREATVERFVTAHSIRYSRDQYLAEKNSIPADTTVRT